MLSDLFYEKSQFAWMFSTLYDLYLNHHAEDELMNQYVVLGLCKAAAIHLVRTVSQLFNITKLV